MDTGRQIRCAQQKSRHGRPVSHIYDVDRSQKITSNGQQASRETIQVDDLSAEGGEALSDRRAALLGLAAVLCGGIRPVSQRIGAAWAA